MNRNKVWHWKITVLGIILLYTGIAMLIKEIFTDENYELVAISSSQTNEWQIEDDAIPGAEAAEDGKKINAKYTIGIITSCIGGSVILIGIRMYQKSKHDL